MPTIHKEPDRSDWTQYQAELNKNGKGCIFWPLTLIVLIIWIIAALFIFGCTGPHTTAKQRHEITHPQNPRHGLN